MKKTLYLFFLFAASFLFVAAARAEVFSSQYLYETSETYSNANYPGQLFRPNVSGAALTVTMKLGRPAGADRTCNLYLREKGSGSGGFYGGKLIDQEAAKTYTWSGVTTTITAGKDYLIHIECGDTVIVYGTAVPTYNNFCNEAAPFEYGLSCDNLGGIKDMYHSVSGYSASTTVNFFPKPTTTCDFEDWGVEPTQLSATDDAAIAAGGWSGQVRYGVVPGTYSYQDNSPILTAGWMWTRVAKTLPLQAGFTYYAVAELCDSQDKTECQSAAHQIGTSAEYSFTVSTSTCRQEKIKTQGSQLSVNTSTSDGSTDINCNYAWPINKVCELARYMFIPSTESVARFVDLKTEIEKKPPFGYVGVYKDGINNLQNASSTTSTVDISSLNNFTIFGTLKDVVGLLSWLIFGFYVFNRLRHFSLHG